MPDSYLETTQTELARWHEETIPDATPMSQSAHLSVEANEVLDLFTKDQEYDTAGLVSDLRLELGDVAITWLNLCSLLDLSAAECIEAARRKNEERDWEEWKNDQ